MTRALAHPQINEFSTEIQGSSPQIQKAIGFAAKIARTPSATTLITGESGTGKELFAKLIHRLSSDGDQPFVDINCGAIPETLLESELFGYERGAFTGAQRSKPGLFELATGGTIFLDEIANTTINLQMKLLKAVENKRFRRLNGTQEINISSRIIAASNVDLHEEVQKGTFREDLYYRLNVCQIKIPPLRERGDDAVELAENFIARFNEEHGKQVLGLSDAARELIRAYPWPGNVRQLKNALERAMLVESTDYIEAEHLLLEHKSRAPQTPQVVETGALPGWPAFNLIDIPNDGIALESLERDIILSAIKKAKGNLSRAARLLKINRGKLRYRIEKLSITQSEIFSFKHDAPR